MSTEQKDINDIVRDHMRQMHAAGFELAKVRVQTLVLEHIASLEEARHIASLVAAMTPPSQ